MRPHRWVVAASILAAIVSVVVLETARWGVTKTNSLILQTPVTTLERAETDGPHIVIAHGFAGSREMMQAYGYSLAHAGYRVHIFDFEGHGAHPLPMSGDVNSIEGTTRRLVDQTLKVIDAYTGGDEPVGLLGHSMATDVLVRVSADMERPGPLVLLSAFSQAITAEHPKDMLLISGQWEGPLRAFGLEAAQMVDPTAEEGRTVEANGVIRSAMFAPYTEHVAILDSRAGRVEAVNWFNRAYDRDTTIEVLPTGWAFLALMASITLLAAPVARALCPRDRVPLKPDLSARAFALLLLLPMLVAPGLAALVNINFLPVLVADYLAVHLGLYGIITLAVMWWLTKDVPLGSFRVIGFWGLLLWGIAVFGFALDRYGANFFPIVERLPIIAALALGAVPFMVADASVAWKSSLWRRIASRAALIGSLAIAVALDFEGLFFLLIIAPVILLFFLVHGTMGRAFGKQVGPLTAGLAMGLILAWALGVSFPMFAA